MLWSWKSLFSKQPNVYPTQMYFILKINARRHIATKIKNFKHILPDSFSNLYLWFCFSWWWFNRWLYFICLHIWSEFPVCIFHYLFSICWWCDLESAATPLSYAYWNTISEHTDVLVLRRRRGMLNNLPFVF